MSCVPDGCDRLNSGSTYASNEGQQDRQVASFYFREHLLGGRCLDSIREGGPQQHRSDYDKDQHPEGYQRLEETLEEPLGIEDQGL